MTSATPGYRLNSVTVLRDLYRLTAALLSLKPIQKIITDEEDKLASLLVQFAEDELVHLLVSTAVSNRLQLEHMRNFRDDPDELTFEPVNGSCGVLKQPPDSAGIPLEFREACNKIIHAEEVELLSDIMEPVLQLRGKQNKNEWYVVIHVLDYVRISVRNFEDALG